MTLYQPPDFELYLTQASYSMSVGWTHNPDLIRLRSLGGFSGSVEFGASANPTTSYGPWAIPEYYRMTVPANGTASMRLGISTNNGVPAGEYTITVLGRAGELSHSASLILTLYGTPQPPPSPSVNQTGPSARLFYRADFYGTPSRGSSVIFSSFLENQGTLAVRVTGLTISGDLGIFHGSLGLPIYLDQNATAVLNMTIMIPVSARIGDNRITASVSWEYLDPAFSRWTTATLLVAQGSISVTSGAGNLPSIASLTNMLGLYRDMILVILGIYIFSVNAVVGYGVYYSRMRKRTSQNRTL